MTVPSAESAQSPDENAPIDLAQTPTWTGAGLRYGILPGFRQVWQSLGLTLGNLIYTVPLAPSEQVNLATVGWRNPLRGSTWGPVLLREPPFGGPTGRATASPNTDHIDGDWAVCPGSHPRASRARSPRWS